MSFLGKILIVAQLVLSVLFMCAAGAVFSTHVSWKKQYDDQKAQITRQQTDHSAEVANLNQKIDALTKQAADEQNRANAIVGREQQLTQQVAALTQTNSSLNQQLQRQTGLAETKSNEAEFRQAEAERQRVQNETLSKSLDEQIRITVALQDELGTLQQTHAALMAQQAETAGELAKLQKIVRAAELPTDAQSVAALAEPPPPVEGVVQDVRKDQTNRTKFVYISLGSDDGLRVGNELDVYRTAERNNGRAKYLGRIKIWSVFPDTAVGLVVEAAKNGIIEVGDNVTTKL